MAENNPTPAGNKNVVSDADMLVTLSGPAVLANKIYATTTEAGLRLAFTEQWDPKRPSLFRVAVVLPWTSALSLRDLLSRQLADIEAVIRAEMDAAKKEGGLDGNPT